MSAVATRTGGEWVVEALRAEGVRHAFGIPGIHNLAIYDALLRQDDIAHVVARHEAGAGFMADGYARASGRPGVVLVTTGPGLTYALTPLVEAYAGSQPLLLVASDIPSALIGKELGALHEVPHQIDCLRPVCRWAETLGAGREIPGAVQGAFHLFRTGRPGPIALSIPTDLLTARVEAQLTPPGQGRRPPCDLRLLEAGAGHLRGARRPLVIAGGGVVAAEAGGELLALARRLEAPVITTVMGRGALPETHPLWLGVLPNKRATQPALEAADVVLAVGCRFAHRSERDPHPVQRRRTGARGSGRGGARRREHPGLPRLPGRPPARRARGRGHEPAPRARPRQPLLRPRRGRSPAAAGARPRLSPRSALSGPRAGRRAS